MRKPLAASFRKCHVLARRFQPKARFEDAQSYWWQARKSDIANRHTTRRPSITTEMWCVTVRPDTEPCDVLQQVGLCNGEQQTCDNVDGQVVCRYVMSNTALAYDA